MFGNTSKSVRFFSDRGAIHRAGWAYDGVCGQIPLEELLRNKLFLLFRLHFWKTIVLLFLTLFCVSISEVRPLVRYDR